MGTLEWKLDAPGLRKAIKVRNAVAMYTSSVLGSGVLVIPALAAQIAGPGSILAWVFLSFASYPFAFTFASLSARRPESGGVYSFAREAFGRDVATVTGWLFVLWDIVGAPAVSLIAASYLAFAFQLGRLETFGIASATLLVAFIVNYRGIVVSNRVQLTIVGSIVVLLLTTIAVSSFSVNPGSFSPFLPHGPLALGTAAALIFWSFLGYENVSNVAEEFENPRRDFHRSVVLSVILISVLYVAVAVITVGTQAYTVGSGVAPFAVILSKVFGTYGGVGTSVLAVFIVFGVVNAYATGISRVVYSAARDGVLPKMLGHLNAKTKAPDAALCALFGGMIPVFVTYYFADVHLETALLVTSGPAILIYVIGCAAGIKLLALHGNGGVKERVLPFVSLVVSLLILPFVGPQLVVSVIVVIAALIYARMTSNRKSVP